MAATSQQETLFKYEPLPSSRTIRVLKLLDGNGPNNQLEVGFEYIDIERVSEWDAISYRWSCAPETTEEYKKLYVFHSVFDGPNVPRNRVIFVRPNLYRCLYTLWENNFWKFCGAMSVWVDAVCINQEDIAEKGQQVQMIGEIFGRARRVLIWLGDPADNSDAIFEDWENTGPEGLVPPEIRLQRRDAELSAQEKQYRASVLAHLLSREYWTRTWIVQEILLAKTLVIFCGKKEMSWEKFITFKGDDKNGRTFHGVQLRSCKVPTRFGGDIDLEKLVRHVRDLDSFRARIQDTATPLQLRRVELHNHSIFQLVMQFSDTKCEDPRDKVYALMSLEKRTPQQAQITVDYTEHRSELYARICESRLTGDYQSNRRFASVLLSALSLCWNDLFEVQHRGSPQECVVILSNRLEGMRRALRRGRCKVSGLRYLAGASAPRDQSLERPEAQRNHLLAAVLDAAEALSSISDPSGQAGSTSDAYSPYRTTRSMSSGTEPTELKEDPGSDRSSPQTQPTSEHTLQDIQKSTRSFSPLKSSHGSGHLSKTVVDASRSTDHMRKDPSPSLIQPQLDFHSEIGPEELPNGRRIPINRSDFPRRVLVEEMVFHIIDERNFLRQDVVALGSIMDGNEPPRPSWNQFLELIKDPNGIDFTEGKEFLLVEDRIRVIGERQFHASLQYLKNSGLRNAHLTICLNET